MSDQLPPPLLHAIESGNAVLFLGTGASFDSCHPNQKKMPSGNDLKNMLSDEFLGGQLKNRGLAEIAELAISETSLVQVQKKIKDVFYLFEPAQFHKIIPKFRWHGIVTTNYDLIVERAYAGHDSPLQALVPFVKNGQHIETEMKAHADPLPLLKLHGCIDHYTDDQIPLILATEQYSIYRKNRTRLFGRLHDWGTEFPIIFCGYSISDPNIKAILSKLHSLNERRPMYYLVMPGLSDIEKRYWSGRRITPIDLTFESFLSNIDKKILDHARTLSKFSKGGTSTLRSHYTVRDVIESASLVSFLSDDVEHVYQGMPAHTANPQQFYRGYDQGWGGIEAGFDVLRRITDTLIVEAILADEEAHNCCDLFVVKGAAGNGKTIVLKRAAWTASHEYEKIVLYVRDGGAIREDALLEISNYTKDRIYLFCDKASFHVDEIKNAINFSNQNKIPLTIIAAERDAEWNVRCEALEGFVSKDFPVRYLSEKEIRDLLRKLEEYDSLGLLVEMDVEGRVHALTDRAERQLLVALHEVTLGKPFEDIIYDEYHRIIPNEAQFLYLDICTLHRFGAGVRAGLISRVSGITFTDFEKRLFKPLEYIVRTRMDKYSGDRVYVARHQRVAEILFDRVLANPEDKYDQLVRMMRGMNLDYASDYRAFGQLVQGRSISRMFASQELGRKFYDIAVDIVGELPYILQQRAIFEMDHNGGDLSIAERCLTRAIEIEPHNKSLLHTVANLARRQALDARNFLMRNHLRKKVRDILSGLYTQGNANSYFYHTSAQVALDDLKDLLSNEFVEIEETVEREFVRLAKEVEQYISEGLQKYPSNEHLHILEFDYRTIVKQNKLAISALRKAFTSNPRLDWVAIRLAERLIDDEEYSETRSVLSKCVQENPSSKRIHFEIAQFYEFHGNEDEKKLIIAHLRRSFIAGDQNYDAQFWFARKLFLNQEFLEAEKIFYNLKMTSMPSKIKNDLRGIVTNESGKPISFNGDVIRIEETFLFLKSPEFGRDIFIHRSNVPDDVWDDLAVNSKVTFSMGFTMKGPAGTSLKLRD